MTQKKTKMTTEDRMEQFLDDELAMESFADVFYKEFATDGDTDYKRIFDQYINGSNEERGVIEDIFMSLCGWSLETLLDKSISLMYDSWECYEDEDDEED